MRLAQDLQQTREGILLQWEHRALLASSSLNVFVGSVGAGWEEKSRTISLNSHPHPVQRAACCGAASFFLTVEGLRLNFSGKLFTVVSFSPPLDSSAHAIVFSNSRCQNLGLG